MTWMEQLEYLRKEKFYVDEAITALERLQARMRHRPSATRTGRKRPCRSPSSTRPASVRQRTPPASSC